MNADRLHTPKVTITHLLTTLGMAAGLIVWIVGYAENISRIEATQEAIQETQRTEAEHQRDAWKAAERRQAEVREDVKQINQNLIEILKELKK